MVKEEGGENDLLDRILADPLFGLTKEELDSIMDVRQFVGCAAEQTEEFLSETGRPLLAANPYDRSATSATRVGRGVAQMRTLPYNVDARPQRRTLRFARGIQFLRGAICFLR